MKTPLRCVSVALVLVLATAHCLSQTAQQQQELAVHLQKARSYLHDKQPNLAVPELLAAAAIDPNNEEVQGNLGVLLFFQGKYVEAIPHLRTVLEIHSGLVKIQGLLGIAEIRTRNYADARKDLEKSFPLIQEDKLKLQVGLELVGFYTQAGTLEDAASVIAQLRKAEPDNPEVLFAAYRTYSDLSGESMMTLALHAPDSAQMHQLLAHEEIKEGNTNGAIAQYRQAIAINPNLPGVHFELAELLNTSVDTMVKQEAELEYRAALTENPQDAKAQCKLADIHAAKGDTTQAYQEYSRAVEMQPTDADAKLGLAKILIDMDQSDKSMVLIEEAIQLEPTNPVAHYRLATLYRKKGRANEARREVDLYKQYREVKEKLRSAFKELLVQPNEIRADEKDEK